MEKSVPHPGSRSKVPPTRGPAKLPYGLYSCDPAGWVWQCYAAEVTPYVWWPANF
jgi:hypothetical protein